MLRGPKAASADNQMRESSARLVTRGELRCSQERSDSTPEIHFSGGDDVENVLKSIAIETLREVCQPGNRSNRTLLPSATVAEQQTTTLALVLRFSLTAQVKLLPPFPRPRRRNRKMMKNKNYVSYLVSLIKSFDYSMLGDVEWDALKDIDVSDNVQLLEVIRDVVRPEYDSWDVASRQIVKDALEAGLALPDYDFAPVLRNVEMPFAPHLNPRTFFLLVQQVLPEGVSARIGLEEVTSEMAALSTSQRSLDGWTPDE